MKLFLPSIPQYHKLNVGFNDLIKVMITFFVVFY